MDSNSKDEKLSTFMGSVEILSQLSSKSLSDDSVSLNIQPIESDKEEKRQKTVYVRKKLAFKNQVTGNYIMPTEPDMDHEKLTVVKQPTYVRQRSQRDNKK